MTDREPTRPTARRIPSISVATVLVVVAAIGGAWFLGDYVPSSSSATARSSAAAASPPVSESSIAGSPPEVHRSGPRAPGELDGVAAVGSIALSGERAAGALGGSDGVVPEGTTVFDGDIPAISRLDPALLDALRRAATDAAHDGVEFVVDSGWRSRAFQLHLFRQAVSTYGSMAKAARWVAVPGKSSHEAGNAVDLGPSEATAWLSEHGAQYGLCQIYRNEPWHYEFRSKAVDLGCPRMYADPTDDPRMHG